MSARDEQIAKCRAAVHHWQAHGSPARRVTTTSVYAGPTNRAGEMKVVRGKRGTKLKWGSCLGNMQSAPARTPEQSAALAAATHFTTTQMALREEFGGVRSK